MGGAALGACFPACLQPATVRVAGAGLSKLPNARKFNLGKYPAGNLRQRFPPAGLGFDGRPSLSEQGFHLLSSLLELCPVSHRTEQPASGLLACRGGHLHGFFPTPSLPCLPARYATRRRSASAARRRCSTPGSRSTRCPRTASSCPHSQVGASAGPPSGRIALPAQDRLLIQSQRLPVHSMLAPALSSVTCSHQRHDAAATCDTAACSSQGISGSGQPRLMALMWCSAVQV